MFIIKFLILLLVLSEVAFSHSNFPNFPDCTNYDSSKTLLETQNGKIQGVCYSVTVNGSVTNTSANVLRWLSIPYAQPPINNLRFKSALPALNWQGVRDGTNWPNMCPQTNSGSSSDFRNISEDCLYLNVFVPYNVYLNQSNKSPILVFIHGGGSKSGSSTDDIYEASTLVALSGIIVVTINYRLGGLGFLHINGTDASGNQGFKDQSLALEWIYNNAVNFNGDNTKITISGQSSGSWSIGYHLIYKPSWPYFTNAILESGNPLEGGSKKFYNSTYFTSIAYQLGIQVGCVQMQNNQNLLTCLQSVSSDQIVKGFSNVFSSDPIMVANGDFNDDPVNLFKKNDFKKCNILTGSNTKEFANQAGLNNIQTYNNALASYTGNLAYLKTKLSSYFNNFPIQNNPGIQTIDQFVNQTISHYNISSQINNSTADFLGSYIQIVTDARFKCPTYQLASLYSSNNLNVYVYLYGHYISSSQYDPRWEAVHGDELPMVFAEPLSTKKPSITNINPFSSIKYSYNSQERAISESFVTFWSNFVKYGNPNGLSQQIWPPFNTGSIYYWNSNSQSVINYNYANDNCCSFFQA